MFPSATDQATNSKCHSEIVNADDIAQVANDFFNVMLGLDFDPTSREEFIPTSDALQSTIQIKGDWHAECRVVVPYKLASKIAGAMFDLKDDEASEIDIDDAMREVVNVIGGNAKGIADGDCRLSLPCVDYYCESKLPPTFAVTFKCMSHPMMIQLIHRD